MVDIPSDYLTNRNPLAMIRQVLTWIEAPELNLSQMVVHAYKNCSVCTPATATGRFPFSAPKANSRLMDWVWIFSTYHIGVCRQIQTQLVLLGYTLRKSQAQGLNPLDSLLQDLKIPRICRFARLFWSTLGRERSIPSNDHNKFRTYSPVQIVASPS